MALRVNSLALSSALPKIELRAGNSRSPSLNVNSQMKIQMRKESGGRRIWRRRTMTKKDETLPYRMERIPFLEEQVRKIKNEGKLLQLDIERLLLSEDNKYDFVNEIAAEANAYVESNIDEYGGEKKAILHVLSNRMNDAGFYRPEAYAESDPFKPGPHYLKEFFT
ncbi:protein PLASTID TRANSCRIPTIONALLY ACTIVE 7 isoform X1 [Vicia villosa]|uniref:protein PLASTID TRANSCRIPTIONALLY ACTIVE 7 isoform X1 n=1 Tax=Vicia villosa TaxID=3911 RepID=UPI00273CCB60|nr:protein PLASTID TRANSCRIPTIONALLY ACTIVE 7 isoform X1 [Vicia villosa]